jgi:hypothetical protein
MHKIFNGWRPKVGLVTFVMAAAAMELWIKSYYYLDFLTIRDSRFVVLSQEGYFFWDWLTRLPSPGPYLRWGSHPLPSGGIPFKPISSGVSYQSFTLILILLSAYLIFWKPRKKSSPN